MKRIISLMLLVLLSTVIPAGSGWTAKKDSDLIFVIVLEKTSYQLGETIPCTMVLANKSKKDVVVNARFLVNYDETFPHEVLFTITDPQGKVLVFQPLVRAAFCPAEKYFRKLLVGEMTMTVYDLSRGYRFAQKGEYTIQAVYENTYHPKDETAWIGRLESNIVKIKIGQ